MGGVCNATRPMAVHGIPNSGWGNRIGWLLTASSIAVSLNKSSLYTYWPRTSKLGGREYDYSEISRIVAFPRVLKFIENNADANGGRRAFRVLRGDADLLPRPTSYVNDYVPEPSWVMWQGLAHKGALSNCNATRRHFLENFRVVQQELRPRVDLCLPVRREYFALHVRSGDRGTSHLSEANPFSPLVWSALRMLSSHYPARPWLIVSENASLRSYARARVRANGWPQVSLRCSPHGVEGFPAARASSSLALGTVALLQVESLAVV